MSTSADPGDTGFAAQPGFRSRGAIVAIGLLCVAFGIVFARVPWPHIDLANNLQRAESQTWLETVRAAFASGVEYRPFLTIATKLAYEIGGLHVWFYKALVLLQLAAILWILLKLLKPSDRGRAVAAFIALACVLGLHTSRVLFLFLPLNAYSATLLLVLIAGLMAIEPIGRRLWWVFLPLTFGALLSLELGILIVPLLLVACWSRSPGSSRRGVIASLTGVALYVVTRRLFGASVGDLASPESGLGFDDLTPPEIQATFAHAPWLFWLYNVGSSLLTVLLSEPRAGKFKFVHAVLRDADAPWQWLHIGSSLVTTVTVAAGLAVGKVPARDRLLMAFGTVLLLGGSALGFLYTRDRIALPAGIGYAMLVFVAVATLLARAPASTVRSTLSLTLVAMLAVCWAWRVGEAGVQLRDRAWQFYLEWTVRYQRETPEPVLLRSLREQVTAHRPPNPRGDAVWTYRWFEREFDRAGR